MKHIILIAVLLLALIPYQHSTDYFTHTRTYYYPSEYIGPAWTGLPSKQYYYPQHLPDTSGFFRSYRQYTHQAVRDPFRLPYHVPYGGRLNARY